jgi:large subunit ribosomal protein L15
MQLHNLKKQVSTRRKKRIGRGGKRGSYSGRGVKGQKSRSGRKLRPAVRDLIIRLPKRRGFANKAKSVKPIIFNLRDLALHFKTAAKEKVPLVVSRVEPLVIDMEFLKQRELVPVGFRGAVKILGDGEIQVPVEVVGFSVSSGAQAKIKKAGGRIVETDRTRKIDTRNGKARKDNPRKSASNEVNPR